MRCEICGELSRNLNLLRDKKGNETWACPKCWKYPSFKSKDVKNTKPTSRYGGSNL